MLPRSRADIMVNAATAGGMPVASRVVPNTEQPPSGRQSRDALRQGARIARGVVGVTPDAPDAPSRARRGGAPAAKQDTALAPLAAPNPMAVRALALANVCLFGIHLIGFIWALAADVTLPLTLHETRYESTRLQQFSCAYERYNGSDTICASNSQICALDSPPSASVSPASLLLVDGDAPRDDAFAVVPIADIDGRLGIRIILGAMELTASAFHLVYGLSFLRVAIEGADSQVLRWFAEHGGLPARWIELSITAGLGAFFVAHAVRVFDAYALLGFAVATYAQMYFGLLIEKAMAAGQMDRALQLLYSPVTALLALPALSTLRQVWLDLAVVSCRDSSLNALSCAKSCFGDNVPVAFFVCLLLLLFVLYPTVTLMKVYYASGRGERWGGEVDRVLRRMCALQEMRGLTRPLYWALHGSAQLVLFLLFALGLGWMLAVRRIASDVLWPVVPSVYLRERVATPAPGHLMGALLFGEVAYTVLSTASKLFLLVFFLTALNEDTW